MPRCKNFFSRRLRRYHGRQSRDALALRPALTPLPFESMPVQLTQDPSSFLPAYGAGEEMQGARCNNIARPTSRIVSIHDWPRVGRSASKKIRHPTALGIAHSCGQRLVQSRPARCWRNASTMTDAFGHDNTIYANEGAPLQPPKPRSVAVVSFLRSCCWASFHDRAIPIGS